MEKFQELRDLARTRIKVADHMVTMTYPLVKDSKLLLAALENVFLSLSYSVGSVLHHQRLFKKIPPFQDTYESKYNMFLSRIVDKHKISKEYIALMQEVHEIIEEHKKSPVEFSRKDRFVICSDTYKIKEVSVEKIRSYIAKTKEFVGKAEAIVSENEEIFKK